jgi:hypothetical protein
VRRPSLGHQSGGPMCRTGSHHVAHTGVSRTVLSSAVPSNARSRRPRQFMGRSACVRLQTSNRRLPVAAPLAGPCATLQRRGYRINSRKSRDHRAPPAGTNRVRNRPYKADQTAGCHPKNIEEIDAAFSKSPPPSPGGQGVGGSNPPAPTTFSLSVLPFPAS